METATNLLFVYNIVILNIAVIGLGYKFYKLNKHVKLCERDEITANNATYGVRRDKIKDRT